MEENNSELIRRAAMVLNPKMKKYKFNEVSKILESEEYPNDEPITDTHMSALCLACSLPDETE